MSRQRSERVSASSARYASEDPDRDRELIRRDEAAAKPLRRHLGGIERRDDGGEADAETGDDAADGEHAASGRERLDERADGEEHSGDDRRPATPDPVGRAPGDERAEERAERDPARDDLALERAEVEIGRAASGSAPEMTPWS